MLTMSSLLILLDGEGCGCMTIAIVLYFLLNILITVAVYAVGIAASIAAAIAAVVITVMVVTGTVIGLYCAMKSFFLAVFAIIDKRKSWKVQTYTNGVKSGEFYEDVVPVSYSNFLFGPLLVSTVYLIGYLFRNVWKHISGMWQNNALNSGLKKFAITIRNIIATILMGVFGAAFGVVVAVVSLAVSLISLLFYCIFWVVVVTADGIYYRTHKIESRCANRKCQEVIRMPVYCCPKCHTQHKKLRPGRWGIFHRKCTCGELLPCLVHGKCKPSDIERAALQTLCPKCGSAISGQSRPLGVALLGGVNAGKTTFKTAFLFNFINEMAVSHKIKTEFTSRETQLEFSDIEKYYRGVRTVPETRPDPVRGYDVTVFEFSLLHQNFPDPRIIQIYDMPGEVFENDNAQDRMDHFAYVEGLVFLLDPYSLQAVAGNDETGEMRIGMMDMETLADRLIDALKKVPGVHKRGNKFTIPIAVCINKVDTPALKNRIGMPAVEKLMKAHPDQFTDEFTTLDYLCRAFMAFNGKSNAMMTIDNAFTTVHYFSCSSMGYVPSSSKHGVRFQPENVSAAVCWLFSRADRKFDKVFTEYNIKDIDDKKKEVGRKDLSFYQEIETSNAEEAAQHT